MTEKEIFINQADKLRRQAEEKAAKMTENLEALSPEEIRQMLHELHVHQIELEMQNEELRVAQADLDVARARYFDLYNLAPVGYCTLSDKGMILETNLTAATLLSQNRSALLKQPLSRYILPDDQDIYYLHRNQLFETGEPQTCDLRMVKNDGTQFWAHLAATAGQDIDCALVCRVVISDITERKIAETQIQGAREYAENIVENVHEPLLVLNSDLKILTANHSFYDTFKVRPEEIIGNFIYDIGNRQWDIPKLRILFEEILPHDTVFNGYEVEHDFLNIGRKTILLNARQIFRENIGSQIILLAMEDITERKRAEAEKAELEARNRQLQKAESLGRMAGAIAHHFNNQLHALMGNIDLAMGDLPLGLNPIQRLLSAMQSARKAAEVSGLMLTYLGQTPGKQEPMDLSEACRRGLTLLQAVAPQGMTLNADFPACALVVRTNAGQIQQVLTHLLTNAWEAAGENQGTIGLTVKTVSQAKIPATKRFPIDWQPREDVYACLEVADTGCGIPESDIEKIFDPFFSTKFTARGLGLSVVLGIAHAHGGGITVESTPGRGSVFRLFLPVSAEDLPLQPEKKVPASEFEGVGTVLLVEDEEMVREITATMLTHLGFAVLEAKDGVEAVEVFRLHQHEIRCVLCDLTMPRMDGWETLTALRKLSPHIPVILSSGFDEAQVLAGEHPERPSAFLGKPYDIQRLRDTIRHVAYASDWNG